ncbi:MAG: hypothetical protein MR842_12380 [Clostridiales bacterium]|nr:hypothetical protein [Clostridiales bacterium]MDO4349938.1 SdrD B-like domain-containing protein [Eubacteriales bacterium]MDY4008160.1 SdrD B-like domain-containing protein [Candidatus Limiplasma sp.]
MKFQRNRARFSGFYAAAWLLTLCMMLGISAAALAQQDCAVTGCAYVDTNANGLADSSEQLMTGVPLVLEKKAGSIWAQEAQATTDVYGRYAFSQLEPGEYRVVCTLSAQELYAGQVGDSQELADGGVRSQSYALAQGQSAVADVALYPSATLVLTAFNDADGDGVPNDRERGVTGVAVDILDGDTVLSSGTTDHQGVARLYTRPGEYTLRLTLPGGYAFTQKGVDNTQSCVGDSGSATAVSEPFSFASGLETRAFAGTCAVGSLSGRAFEDMNNNGVMDEGEPGVEGVVVHIEGKRTGLTLDYTTDATGEYRFDRLASDTYIISATLPEGMLYARYSSTGGDLRSIFTGSNLKREFPVKNAESVSNKNIGVVQNGVIRGVAFLDTNYNGKMDEGEPGYANVTVEAIKISTNESLGRTVTAGDGSFALENLRGGEYRLRAILPDDGSIFTVTAAGAAGEVNLFEQRGSRRENSIQPLSIASGGETVALIGVARGATVSGTVFQDADYDGVLSAKEKPLSGLRVYAVDASGAVAAMDTTNAKGGYTLTGIMPGSYTIQFQRKAGFGFTRLRPAEKGGSHVAVLEGEMGVTAAMEIAMGETLSDVNAGMLPSSTVSGILFHDTNDNGLRDEGEISMVNAKVRLFSEEAEVDLIQSVSDTGSYFFDGVMPGSYTLTYILPEYCEMARVAEGGNTVAGQGLETQTEPFQVAMGENCARPLAGAVTLGSFSGVVFHDQNANGIMDAGEAPLGGSVTLMPNRADLEAQTVQAGEDGRFEISGLRPAEYSLSLELAEGYIFSHDITGLSPAEQDPSAAPQEGDAATNSGRLVLPASQTATLACPWQTLVNRQDKQIGAIRPATISGEIWLDENKDGAQGAGELLMTGLAIELVDESTGESVARVDTSEEGFAFENVRPGTYCVRFQLPAQSSPAESAASTFAANGSMMVQRGVMAGEGEAVSGLSAGLVSHTSIGGVVWLEESRVRTPVSGVTVMLFQGGQTQPLQTAVTGEDGSYRFDGLWPADYYLQASLPSGMVFVKPEDPNYPSGASAITAFGSGSGTSELFYLHMAQHELSKNILYIKPAKVGDIAWLDENRNGLVDGDEPRIPGITVSLLQNGQAVYQTVTDAYGYYLFNDVYPGDYVLEAQAYPELTPATPVESLRIISSCLTSGDGTRAQSDPFTVVSGSTNVNFDLGYVLLEGQQIPSAIVSAPTRDWTIANTRTD